MRRWRHPNPEDLAVMQKPETLGLETAAAVAMRRRNLCAPVPEKFAAEVEAGAERVGEGAAGGLVDAPETAAAEVAGIADVRAGKRDDGRLARAQKEC